MSMGYYGRFLTQRACNVLSAFDNRCGSVHCEYYGVLISYAPHWHNEIEIIYCISGSFKTRINDIEYSVEAGQAVL